MMNLPGTHVLLGKIPNLAQNFLAHDSIMGKRGRLRDHIGGKMSDIDNKALTSLRIFRKFINRTETADGRVSYDAEAVVSRECYELWLTSRKVIPPRPEKAFQRSLSAHLGSVDGRLPFSAEEEAAILKAIRRKGHQNQVRSYGFPIERVS